MALQILPCFLLFIHCGAELPGNEDGHLVAHVAEFNRTQPCVGWQDSHYGCQDFGMPLGLRSFRLCLTDGELMSELERLMQREQRAWLESVGTKEWTTIYRSVHEADHSVVVHCALIPNSYAPTALQDFSFDLSVGDGRPSCWQSANESGYERFGNGAGVEPLVLVRIFHDHRPQTIELLEEFRLFHNLSFDAMSESYIKVDDAGQEETIARIKPDLVDVRTVAIRQFLAIKEMHLSVGIDSRVYSTLDIADVPSEEREITVRRDRLAYLLYVRKCDFKDGAESLSRLIGKHLVAPLPKEKSGMWPYNEPKKYEEFIIGRDAAGEVIEFTCEPDRLANYFGANPGAPQLVTPVFFRRDVLTKYYHQPNKYSVTDGELQCASLWSLRIDNNGEDHVIVFLGDLGHLPLGEQKYWRSFNVPPDGRMSEVHARRNFLAEFTDASRVDLVFKAAFERFQEEWHERFGWYLFRPLLAGDRHHLVALRVPMTDEQAEFDMLVLSLTKLLIDSINEEQLVVLGIDKDLKGIAKLEAYLAQEAVADAAVHIKFLRNLQSLRSSGVGHRKGSGYEKAAAAVGVGSMPLSEVFAQLLRGAATVVAALSAHFLTVSARSTPV